MKVAYGETPVQVPANAYTTEITTYFWTNARFGAAFLGEFDSVVQTFTAWELVGPTSWLLRPEILAPPLDCIGMDTTSAQKWRGPQAQEWLLLPSSAWRLLQP